MPIIEEFDRLPRAEAGPWEATPMLAQKALVVSDQHRRR